jgi:DNA-directed RNA polymerase subunit beta
MGYRVVQYGKKASRRNYSKMRYDIELPNLIEIQTKSFEWFLDEGIRELLQDISPIEAHNGDMKLYFEAHEFSDAKFSVQDSKKRDVNFSKQLSVKVKLESVLTGEVRDTNVLMTEIPVMTPTGTFVINGAERVVVSQIIRSSGAYFTSEMDKKLNQLKYIAQIIPTRGAWIEMEMGSKDILYAKLDRSKKVPMTTFMRAIGLGKKKDILDVFGKNDYLELLKCIQN